MARTRNQGSKWIRKSTRLALYLRDGHACAYCGAGIEDGVMLTLDHVVPCELGGTNETANLVTACLSCNSSKRDLPLRSFMVVLADRGVDTSKIPARIRRLTRRSLDKYRQQARAALANR